MNGILIKLIVIFKCAKVIKFYRIFTEKIILPQILSYFFLYFCKNLNYDEFFCFGIEKNGDANSSGYYQND